MIIDTFMFGMKSELDVLEIRLNELNSVVNYFVIVESPTTHSGRSKPLVFLENKKRFEPFLHKIIYVESDLSSVEGSWAKENLQRNHILKGLSQIDNLSDDATILISDADEIPSSEIVEYAEDYLKDSVSPLAINMSFHAFYANLIGGNGKEWVGTVAAKYAWVKKESPQFFRNNKDYFTRTKGRFGWHLSYLGGCEAVKNKLQSFAHTENQFKDLPLEEFEKIFKERVLKDKQFCFENNSTPLELAPLTENYLPRYILDNQDKLKHLILNEH